MANLYWLLEERVRCLRPSFSKGHGHWRVDGYRVQIEIIFINHNWLP